MDIRYRNLIQFIFDVRHEAEVREIVGALRQLSHAQIEELQIEYNVIGHPIHILAKEMLRACDKEAKGGT